MKRNLFVFVALAIGASQVAAKGWVQVPESAGPPDFELSLDVTGPDSDKATVTNGLFGPNFLLNGPNNGGVAYHRNPDLEMNLRVLESVQSYNATARYRIRLLSMEPLALGYLAYRVQSMVSLDSLYHTMHGDNRSHLGVTAKAYSRVTCRTRATDNRTRRYTRAFRQYSAPADLGHLIGIGDGERSTLFVTSLIKLGYDIPTPILEADAGEFNFRNYLAAWMADDDLGGPWSERQFGIGGFLFGSVSLADSVWTRWRIDYDYPGTFVPRPPSIVFEDKSIFGTLAPGDQYDDVMFDWTPNGNQLNGFFVTPIGPDYQPGQPFTLYISMPSSLRDRITGTTTAGTTVLPNWQPRMGDIYDDGVVNLDDYFELAENYYKTSADSDWELENEVTGVAPIDCDLNFDGAVNLDDYFELADNYGMTDD